VRRIGEHHQSPSRRTAIGKPADDDDVSLPHPPLHDIQRRRNEMTTYAAAAERTTAPQRTPTRRTLIRAELALVVSVAAWIPFAAISLAATLTPDGHHFRHPADYWYTGLGLAHLPALIVLLAAFRSLHEGRDGRIGRIGVLLTSAGLATITALLVYSLVAGTTSGTGPLYPIAALATDLGMLLFCIGAYRGRLLPRTLVAGWFIAWILGGVLGPTWGPPLLVAVYLLIAATLPRTVSAREPRNP
jgi:hypothetical protein